MDFNTFFAVAWLIFGLIFIIRGALIKGYMDYLAEKEAAIQTAAKLTRENAELRRLLRKTN